MTKPAFRLAAMGALALLYSAAPTGQAQAAEGLDNCDRMITDVTNIVAPGRYCLAADITSDVYSGGAITIEANDVTIDCSNHVIRDIATISGRAAAIYAKDRQNITVRNCTIIGFQPGIWFDRGNGYLIENNLIRDSREYGIRIGFGENNVVRGNRVLDINPAPYYTGTWGIEAYADVVNNRVAGVTGQWSRGITVFNGNEAIGNRVHIIRVAGGNTRGIVQNGSQDRSVISGNHVTGTGNEGIVANICNGNTVAGFDQSYEVCTDSIDNL